MGKKWLPLESNPDVLTDFTAALGLDVSKHAFHDVFGLDEVSAQCTAQTLQTSHTCRGRSHEGIIDISN